MKDLIIMDLDVIEITQSLPEFSPYAYNPMESDQIRSTVVLNDETCLQN